MTAQELIQKLQQFPPTATVYLYCPIENPSAFNMQQHEIGEVLLDEDNEGPYIDLCVNLNPQ